MKERQSSSLSWLLDFNVNELFVPDQQNLMDSETNSSTPSLSLNQNSPSQQHPEPDLIEMFNTPPAAAPAAGRYEECSTGNGNLIEMTADDKPRCTYTELIEKALHENPEGLTVSQIYSWIAKNHGYFRLEDDRWKNSVRHNLSINPYFEKRGKCKNGAGHVWTIAESCRKNSATLPAQERKTSTPIAKDAHFKTETDRIVGGILQQYSIELNQRAVDEPKCQGQGQDQAANEDLLNVDTGIPAEESESIEIEASPESDKHHYTTLDQFDYSEGGNEVGSCTHQQNEETRYVEHGIYEFLPQHHHHHSHQQEFNEFELTFDLSSATNEDFIIITGNLENVVEMETSDNLQDQHLHKTTESGSGLLGFNNGGIHLESEPEEDRVIHEMSTCHADIDEGHQLIEIQADHLFHAKELLLDDQMTTLQL